MATKAPELSISDLAGILAALTEITKPYQLGIQLKIDLTELDKIEKNHPKHIDRQKTEVIKYWLHNSPDASWITLAEAVERMGGHAGLVERLREKERSSEEPFKSHLPRSDSSFCYPHMEPSVEEPDDGEPLTIHTNLIRTSTSYQICLNSCEDRTVLLLSKTGHGKSTLGNKMLNYDGYFRMNNRERPQTNKGSALLWSASRHKNYEVTVYDHSGLFEGASSIDTLSSELPRDLNLVIFVLKCSHSFDAKEQKILDMVVSEWQIRDISALVLTHCDRSPEEREKMKEQFKNDHPSVAELMGKGIFAVGFPDNSHIHPGSQLSQSVEDDKKELRQLIYTCDDIKSIR